MIPFVKTHGLGNDFILVEKAEGIPSDYSDFTRHICDRHFGIGADGLILWNRAGDEIRMETVSGMYTLRRVGREYEADMGEPKLAPKDIPFVTAAPIERVV